jgi:hypothetical protein
VIYVKKIERLAMSDQDCHKKDIENRKRLELTQDTGIYIFEKKIMNILLGPLLINDYDSPQALIEQGKAGMLTRDNYSLGGLSFTSEKATQVIERLKKEELDVYLQNVHSIDINGCKYPTKILKELMRYFFGLDFFSHRERITTNDGQEKLVNVFMDKDMKRDKRTPFEEAFYYYSLSLRDPPKNE